MAEKEFLLEIVTPEHVFYSGNAEKVIVRTVVGDICILKNHEPHVAPLDVGQLKVVYEGKDRFAVLSQGFIKVEKTKVTILTDTAEWADEIDLKRAEEAKERAKRRLDSKNSTTIDVVRAELALRKAIQRINIARK
ncbi:ATP synthase F1 subunit epsilon [Sedimentibacter sp. zth1]|uniref:ATP synthase F1 subunit epsilon n=1 Tax=Sedimentibacter sp. zth1 TaxID=2816908 RepID=UPI001A933753|nr:ATP synthase F1 subunit epsilon [Sedimentibacter sp. zth1]QSX05041.1 ATP synthase F1 subunit epsilon [Sedimentibacter sp. zth1]